MPARIVPVASPSDPAIEPYARIRERDLRGREGLFIAESETVVRMLVLRSRFRARLLLLEQRRVDALADVLDALPEDVPAFVVTQPTMDAVVGFSIHRGVLALGERGEAIDARALLAEPSGGVVVGLIGLTNHDNVGGIFRNAAAFGAKGVLVDASTCDPLYRKAIRVSVGAALMVPFARCASAEAMLEALAAAGVEALALTPRAEASIDGLEARARRALLLGTEGDGLPEAVLRQSRCVRVAMAPGLDSLNVAVASGIALYEVTKGDVRR